jgi:hypothetical protein
MVALTAKQIARVFELGHRITDENDAALFFHAIGGDFNAKGNFALRTGFDKDLESPRVQALFFLRDLDGEAVTCEPSNTRSA